MTEFNYHQREIARAMAGHNGDNAMRIKITGDKGETRWMNVTPEWAQAIADMLDGKRVRVADTTTWANGSGAWHAMVRLVGPWQLDRDEEMSALRRRAQRAIRRQIDGRGESGPGWVCRVVADGPRYGENGERDTPHDGYPVDRPTYYVWREWTPSHTYKGQAVEKIADHGNGITRVRTIDGAVWDAPTAALNMREL